MPPTLTGQTRSGFSCSRENSTSARPRDTMRSRSINLSSRSAPPSPPLSAPNRSPLSVPGKRTHLFKHSADGCTAGSLSTRTTHPHVVNLFQRILDALSLSVRIETPFKFSTKGRSWLTERTKNTLRASAPNHHVHCSRPSAGRYQRSVPRQALWLLRPLHHRRPR